MDQIAEKAKDYVKELQKLLDLNFENPNEELKNFAEKNKMDLKDPKIKKYFLDVRKKYLEDINKFYEKNFLSFNKNSGKRKIKGNSAGENTNTGKSIIDKAKNSPNEKNLMKEFLNNKKKVKSNFMKFKEKIPFGKNIYITGILFIFMMIVLLKY